MKYLMFLMLILLTACQSKQKTNEFSGQDSEVKLMVLAPGHFHADLLQKAVSSRINDSVYVYAQEGVELNQYLSRIESYNQRDENPTSWNELVYSGDDFLKKMLAEKKGNVVVLAGNNQKKTNYILQSINAGFNVLSDKPMAINKENFQILERAFKNAEQKNVFLYDIMTERYDILNIIERELMKDKELFGEIQLGTIDFPAVSLESVHHFYKNVSGSPLIRPAWYYDVEQQGEGIVDVTTHLIDLVNWKCFPDIALDYKKDVKLLSAKHWTTNLTLDQFSKSTQLKEYPGYLQKYISNNKLKIYANGVINYQIKGVNIVLKVVWNFQAPEGGGDTYSSIIKGSKATLQIIQNKEQSFTTQLYIKKTKEVGDNEFKTNLEKAIKKIQKTYPFVSIKLEERLIRVDVPLEFREGDEAHFSRVAEKYFDFLVHRNMPDWEIPNMLTKYYITTSALELAKQSE